MLNNTEQHIENEVDVRKLLLALCRRIWILLIVAILSVGLGLAITATCITPLYASSFSLYVNNHNDSEVLTSLNNSDISTRQSLANTTAKIATSKTVLRKISEKVDVNKKDIRINTSVDGGSGILTITVITPDQHDSFQCANSMSSILSDEVSRIIEGSSIQIIDSPLESASRYSPNYSRNAILAGLIGLCVAAFIILLREWRDDTVREMSELEKAYGIPVIGTIPDLEDSLKDTGYSGYYQYGHYAHTMQK